MRLKDIKKISVLGTGVMGHGIALVCAQAGYEVSMYGRSEESLKRGFENIHSGLELLAENDLLSDASVKTITERIKGVTSLVEAVSETDFVIESIVEDLRIKQVVFNEIDKFAPPHAVLATNTSGLSPTLLAEATSRPEKVIVTHFWNPPHLIPLVEIAPGEKTSVATLELARELILNLDKKPVILKKEIPGFIGNRLQFALLREALYIVEQGWASPEDVDAAVKCGFGRRLAATGPIESADLGGLDVFYNIQEYLNKELCRTQSPSPLLKEKVDKGFYGAKNKKGFYNWEDNKIKAIKIAREEDLINRLKKDKRKK